MLTAYLLRIAAALGLTIAGLIGGVVGFALVDDTCTKRRRRYWHRRTCRACAIARHPSRSSAAALERAIAR